MTLGSGHIINGFIDITTGALTDGTAYNFRASITDIAGNTSAASTDHAWDITIDASAPTQTATITSVTDDDAPVTGPLTSGGVTDDNSLDLAGTISDVLTGTEVLAVYDGATRLGTASVVGTNWSYTDSTLTNGDAVSYTPRLQGAPWKRN